MTSREVKELLSSEKGVAELYKKALPYMEKIDKFGELYTNSDILNEYELSHSMESLAGCYSFLNPIAGALEALLIENESNFHITEESKFTENLRVQDQNSAKIKARALVSDIRRFCSDFDRYCSSADKLIVVAQSRLKRLTVESSAKGVDFKGDKTQPAVIEKQEEQTASSHLDVTWDS